MARQLLPGFERAGIRADVVAGVTTWVMLVPQAMGYALLAGLPPQVGLYASLLPLVAYAVLGSSRSLAVGPVALDSMMVGATIFAMGASNPADALAIAAALTLIVGVLQVSMGALGLGFVANFLSRPVLSGFTSAAAILIASSQLGALTGLELPRGSLAKTVGTLLSEANSISFLALTVGLTSLSALIVLKRTAPRFPRGLVVLATATLAAAGLGLAEQGLAVVGVVPSGLPGFSWPGGSLLSTPDLWTAAFAIALVSFVESLSVGRHLAREGRYEISPNRELVAVGTANLSAGLFGGYAVAGGFSRSAVNAQAGARSQLAALTTAALVGLTLLLLTPLFHTLPKAALAAIVMAAVSGLVDPEQARTLWRVKRDDFWLLLVTFAATLALGVQLGLLSGVLASLGLFLVRATRPHVAVLGRLPGTSAYRNVVRFEEAVQIRGMLVLRIDAQFYFGNVTFLKDTVRSLRASRPDVRSIVLDSSGMNQIDSSALDALRELERELAEGQIVLYLAHVKGPVRDVLERAGWLQELRDEGRVHHRVHEAVCAARERCGSAETPATRRPGDTEPPPMCPPPCRGELAEAPSRTKRKQATT